MSRSRNFTRGSSRQVKGLGSTSDVFKDFVFKTKAKATAFKAKAKDLQKKQGQGLGTKAKAKKYSRPTLRTSKSRFYQYPLYQTRPTE